MLVDSGGNRIMEDTCSWSHSRGFIATAARLCQPDLMAARTESQTCPQSSLGRVPGVPTLSEQISCQTTSRPPSEQLSPVSGGLASPRPRPEKGHAQTPPDHSYLHPSTLPVAFQNRLLLPLASAFPLRTPTTPPRRKCS